VEKGKARILIGPDAYLLDAVSRVAPAHGFEWISKFGNVLGKVSGKLSRARNKAPETATAD
jgi:hypothetical protein